MDIIMKRSKRICFVIPDLGCGGAQRVMCTLANEFSKVTCDVVILAFHNGPANCFYELNSCIKVVTLPDNERRNRSVDIGHNTKIMRKLLMKINADLVIAFLMPVTMYCFYATRNTTMKLLLSERNDPNTGLRYSEWKSLRDNAFDKADACVFQTQAAMEYYGNNITSKSMVIRNPVSVVPNFEAVDAKLREHRIVNVGRFDPQKNHRMLLNAFSKFARKHPEYTLEIYGRDFHFYKAEIQNYRDELGLERSVRLCEPVNDLFEKIYNARMFVLSSDYEGMSNALLESVMLGIPSISTDCPIYGAREIIKNNENGILIPINDEDTLYQKMCLLAENDILADKFTSNRMRFAQKYSVSVIFTEWRNHIKNVIGIEI